MPCGMQTAGGPDAAPFETTLAHRIMTYVLFITFIVAVPILFNNFLVRMCVGAKDQRSKGLGCLLKFRKHVKVPRLVSGTICTIKLC